MKQMQLIRNCVLALGVLSGSVAFSATEPSTTTTATQNRAESTSSSKKKFVRPAGKKTTAPMAKKQPQESTAEKANTFPGYDPDIDLTVKNVHHGVTVTTTPLLGLKSAYNASDLLYVIPSMNQDLLLLIRRQDLSSWLSKGGGSLDDRPLVIFSGGIEGQLNGITNYDGSDSGDINLSTAELDVWPIVSSWASGFISLDYDDSSPATGSRVTNSRVFLNRGFLTLGNLNTFPMYFTIGQMYVPFGRYSSGMLTTPVTKSLARIQARSALVGYYQDGFYAEGYGFEGEQTSTQAWVRQGGGNVGYQTNYFLFDGLDIGVGAVSNIADSQGMQSNGLAPIIGNGLEANEFAGFANTPGGDQLAHRVPGVDGHIEASKGPVTCIVEWAGAVEQFSSQDLTYNGHAAEPQALSTEIDLNFNVRQYPITVGGAYGHTWQALALNLPQQSVSVVLSTSLIKDTMQGIEFRHDWNYNVTPNTTGGSDLGPLPVSSVNIGGSRNIVTAQVGVYF